MTQETAHLIYFGSAIFTLGMIGFLTRRSMILMFLSLELMLAGVSINLVGFAKQHHNYQGQVLAIIILTVAACEAAIALALIVSLSRRKSTLDIQAWSELNEVPMRTAEVPITMIDQVKHYPKLTPAGLEPSVAPSPVELGYENWNALGENSDTPMEKTQNA